MMSERRSTSAAFTNPEEEWRHDCLAFAEVKNLQHVEEMRAFYFVSCSLLKSVQSV